MTEERSGKVNESAVSIRTLNIIMFAAAIVLAALLFLTAMKVSDSYSVLHDATGEYIECQQDAQKMQEASDYMTDRVRSFVATGKKQYADDFFEEVYETRRRDEAIASMQEMLAGTDTYRYLEEALEHSNELVKIENYAMRLAIEAYGLDPEEYPEDIQKVVLQLRHSRMTRENQRQAAIDLVFDSEYQRHKALIREKVALCSSALIDTAQAVHHQSSDHLLDLLHQQTVLIAALMLAMLGIVLFTARLVLRPLQEAVRSIREEKLIPQRGSVELQYLASSYNEMYETTRKQQETLSYEASHDALTGLSNRKMFDHARATCDPAATTMILVDVDYFKEVNDTYGHEIGDKLLKRVASVLRASFRSEDYVCRIGGDEFAVLMLNSSSALESLVRTKIENAQKQLAEEKDGIPAITISVGVAFPDRPNPTDDIFIDADTALYKVKNAGKNGLAFYE